MARKRASSHERRCVSTNNVEVGTAMKGMHTGRRRLPLAMILGFAATSAMATPVPLYYNSSSAASTSAFYVTEDPNASPPYSSPTATQPCGTIGGCSLFSATQYGSNGSTAIVGQTANLSNFPQAGTGQVGGNAQAQSSNGEFHISTSSQAQSSTPNVYTEVDTLASATLDDEIQLNSTIYPDGTVVTIGEILNLHARLTGVDAAGQGPCTSASVVDYITVRAMGMTLTNNGCSAQPFSQSVQTTVQARIDPGADLEIFGNITAESDAFSQGCAPGQVVDSSNYYNACFGGSTTAGVNALDTASLYLVLPPGVTLTSGSGYDYAPPAPVASTPEPASFTLLAAGLAGLVIFRSRSKKRHSEHP